VSEHTIIQIKKFIVFIISLKKRALQIGFPPTPEIKIEIDGLTNENTNGVWLHLTLPATHINYKQVEACVRTSISGISSSPHISITDCIELY
jgi:hypothetical protein